MYSRTTLGSFYPVKSIVHKLNPVNKIFCLLISVLLLIASMSLKLHLLLFCYILLISFLSLVPFRFYFNIMFKYRYILLFITFILLFVSMPLNIIIIIILKLLIILLLISVISFTTSSSELAYGIEKLISPFNIFNINFSKFINSIVGQIRFIPSLITNENLILKAVDSRGMNYNYNNIIERFFIKRKMFGSSFMITKRKIKNAEEEANLRMYSTKKYRTNARVNKFSFIDLLYLLVFLLQIIFCLYERGILNALFSKFML